MTSTRRATLRTIVVAMAAAALPRSLAQQPTRRIAFINVGPAAPNQANVEAFRAGLRELGYVEGRNLAVDYRWADGRVEALPALVRELLALKPDVVVCTGGPASALAAKMATASVPVVFIAGDPVAEGLVTSLARPGGNLTGLAVLAEEVESKRLEILREALPRSRRLAVIWNPARKGADQILGAFTATAQKLDYMVTPFAARDPAGLEAVFAGIAAAKVDALAMVPDPVLGFERRRIVAFATANRLPGMYFWREFAELGGLMSYGTSLPAVYRRTATYVDRIFKGAKPGELPVELPTTFELVVNLKTAKSFGLELPATLLARADEVIQ